MNVDMNIYYLNNIQYMADWTKITSRGNVDDRRSAVGRVGGVGIVGAVVYLLFNYLSTGTVDVSDVLTTLQSTQVTQQQIDTTAFQGADDYEVFVSTVLGSTTDMWSNLFKESNQTYTPPHLVLFRGS